ncbi:MAG: ABC transporter permease, partial [Hyphomicrobiales bacterium]|nr:ABC transporter permease [Hyphomicrobiales bacterium]
MPTTDAETEPSMVARPRPRAWPLRWGAAVGHALWEQVRIISSDALGLAGLAILVFFTLVGTIGLYFAPHDPFEYLNLANGDLARLLPPSRDFLLGTNFVGQDVLSQMLYGTLVTLLMGLTSGLLIGTIGTAVGVLSGYYGGWVDNLLMRIVDIFMGVPTLPFAILFVALTEPKMSTIIVIFVLLFWRTSARAIRSSVLTLKERQYVKAAHVAGASNLRIMMVHILPNVLPLAFLYVVFGAGAAVLAEASLSFIGLGDPMAITWGQMINMAFKTAAIRDAWWWVLPPS